MPELAHQIREARGEAEGTLVLLHGRGTDEFDLLPLAEALDPDERLTVVTPRGPLAQASGGAHWYAVERVGFPNPATFKATVAQLGEWLDSLPARTGIPWEKTVLGGFSQGAVMAYAMGLGRGRVPPAGIIALSGFIPTVEGFELELIDRAGYPVAIGHGVHDPVIAVDFGRRAHERLQAAGLEVLYRESAMGHGIDPRFIALLAGWIAALTGPTDS